MWTCMAYRDFNCIGSPFVCAGNPEVKSGNCFGDGKSMSSAVNIAKVKTPTLTIPPNMAVVVMCSVQWTLDTHVLCHKRSHVIQRNTVSSDDTDIHSLFAEVASPTDGLGGHSTPLLLEVVPETSAIRWLFTVQVAGEEGLPGLELDSPVCKIRRMKQICCFRLASKSWKVFSFRGLRPLIPWPGPVTCMVHMLLCVFRWQLWNNKRQKEQGQIYHTTSQRKGMQAAAALNSSWNTLL